MKGPTDLSSAKRVEPRKRGLVQLITAMAMFAPMASAAAAQDIGISAFRDICVATAPSFKGAAKKARRYVGSVTDSGPLGLMGMAKDNSIGVQIKPDKECAVTTPDRPSPEALTAEFQTSVFGSSFASPGKRNPLVAKVGGTAFIFVHDTNGGEAYVMLRKK